jgi:mannose-1-phosphate guanylyltransferase
VFAAFVLAAGHGTRLRPLTDTCPKALVPIGDRPALAHVLDRLAAANAARVVVNAHHHAALVAAYARARGAQVSEETSLLGTAGGLAAAGGLLGPGSVLVWNADILADIDAAAVVAAHAAVEERRGALATLVVRPCAGAPPGWGNVGLDAAGEIVRLRQQCARSDGRDRRDDEVQAAEFVGVHVVGPALRAELPERGCLVGDVYLPALRRGARLASFVGSGPFWDFGTVADYLAANRAWLATRGLASFVGPGTAIAPGIDMEGSVVGAGARVTGAGALERVVVWPGELALAPLADAVVAAGRVSCAPRDGAA